MIIFCKNRRQPLAFTAPNLGMNVHNINKVVNCLLVSVPASAALYTDGDKNQDVKLDAD